GGSGGAWRASSPRRSAIGSGSAPTRSAAGSSSTRRRTGGGGGAAWRSAAAAPRRGGTTRARKRRRGLVERESRDGGRASVDPADGFGSREKRGVRTLPRARGGRERVPKAPEVA